MYDDAGFLVLSAVSFIAIAVSLSALIWAAVQDGRDERAFLRSPGGSPRTRAAGPRRRR